MQNGIRHSAWRWCLGDAFVSMCWRGGSFEKEFMAQGPIDCVVFGISASFFPLTLAPFLYHLFVHRPALASLA